MTTTQTMARCAWEVTAGMIPGQADDQYTRQWFLTSDQARAENNRELWLGMIDDATTYYKSLLDPGILNWVRLDWVWF